MATIIEQEERTGRFDLYTEAKQIQGEQRTTVYVYQAPVRAWHWLNALGIVILAVTGYLIGSPPPSIGGEASSSFLFGNVRLIHFATGQVLVVLFLARILYAFVGNHHARQLFLIPLWSGRWWREVIFEARWYSFLERDPKRYVGHNPLAQLAMFFAFVLPMVVMILTGGAMLAEEAGQGTVWDAAFGWVTAMVGNTMLLHTIHHLGMWLIVCFAIVHIYAAIREDIMSRQSMLSTMVSGWRMFRD